MGMLELDHPVMIRFYIGDVLLSSSRFVHDFLPMTGEIVFPSAVPFCFVLPPMVTVPPASVCPMPTLDVATFGDHPLTACRAVTLKGRLRFFALLIHEGKFHDFAISSFWPMSFDASYGAEPLQGKPLTLVMPLATFAADLRAKGLL